MTPADLSASLDHARAVLSNDSATDQQLRAALQALTEKCTPEPEDQAHQHADLEEANQMIESLNDELDSLRGYLERQGQTLDNLVKSRTSELTFAQTKLEKLISLCLAVSKEWNHDALMELILVGAKELANADAGTLYIKTEDNRLNFQIMQTDSLGIAKGGSSGEPIDLPPVNLVNPDTGEPNHKNVVTHAAIENRTVFVDDAYDTDKFDFSGTHIFDQRTGYRSISFLTVPLSPRDGEVIGVIQLLNSMDPETGQVVPFSEDVRTFIEALASQAAVALDNHNLVEEQARLFDGFIKLMANAIDAKSAYTGGHCMRVPELGMMLTRAACDSQAPYFKDFDLNEAEWREFEVAGWLHDCGKVTTPEYVVDKATKLETIYNRIHEIRMRFEILIRDAQIDYWSGVAGGGDEKQLAQQRDVRINRLTEEFDFIANCNVGGEFMSDEDVKRVQSIGNKTWVRHLSDRKGLSHLEMAHLDTIGPEADLPVTERLLDDKDEHIIPRQGREKTPFGENEDGRIQMTIPEHMYNLGEIYNLTIRRGTLTAEERFKINDHIVQTLMMLEGLPFPKHLRRVPEYACGHHETMIGTGYPQRLTREQMSIPARVLAIADIFEALTAADRPYKKAKTISESLKIMSFMRNDQHIDPDLFDLFLTSGVWKQYADAYLLPEQIDEVDIKDYIRAEAAE